MGKEDYPISEKSRGGIRKFFYGVKKDRVKLFRGGLIVLVAAVLGLAVLAAVVARSPFFGTQGADLLRNLLGPKPVALLEGVVFSIQDAFKQLDFRVSKSTPDAPWQMTAPVAAAPTGTPVPGLTYSATPLYNPLSENPTAALTSTLPPGSPASTPTPQPKTPLPTVRATHSWMPAALKPLGTIPGEGVWSSYIQDQAGETIAYKTFLQPDSARPYVVVGIVAFDLTHVYLHYVLGTEEPTGANDPFRSGKIPYSDNQPGLLMAAFNGGFKTVNGQFGVMADGIVIVPLTPKLGTLALYNDGSVRIGEWGTDLTYSNDMVVIRQNCPLLVHNGEINPLVYNNSVNDWGGTIDGAIVTFRSGLGISQDGKTLYYFAGQSLNMVSLAESMVDAGAYQAMQLDINNYYVLFTKFQTENGAMTGIPLLPKDMVSNLNRFLSQYSRDFFYLTANKP